MRKLPILPLISILLCAAILLGAYNFLIPTRERIAAEELTAKMQTILPGSSAFEEEEYTGDDANIQRVYKGETGYVIQTMTYGYAGNITMLIGVTNDGAVTGLQVRDMKETYGLGWEALTDWQFLAQYLNAASELTVGEDIDAISGATVTTKAITRSVNSAVGFVTGADVSSGATTWGG